MDLELLEALALSADRSAALAQLLPGSEDHDYYRALHAQHRGALDEAEAVIEAWPERHGRSGQLEQLRLRQLLHRAVAPGVAQDTLDQLRDRLGVRHDHEAAAEARDPSRPSRLADGAFHPAALLRQAVRHDANLAQVTDEGLAELVEAALDPSRRRSLLARLRHTAQPQVVALIADDLAQRGSGGYGALAIHRELTLDQLHALAELRDELRGHPGWIAAVVTRMRPPAGVDLALDRAARAAYLDALWRFVGELPPSANSLKAHVLWHLLDTRRSLAAASDPLDPAFRALFRAYLALPRDAGYLTRGWIDQIRRTDVARLGTDFTAVTGLPPAGSDEELVRDVLQRAPDDAEDLAAWLDRAWLDAEVAAARLLAGQGDAERAALVLGPARAAALRDRVELAWCPHNPAVFAADAAIALELDVKNVPELVVKVFRIDPLAYYQHHRREVDGAATPFGGAVGRGAPTVDAALDLDGLAASHERVLRFHEPAIRRSRHRLELGECTRPGTYVVDLIGNGLSSRAVIHKGRLRHVARVGAAGHVVTILDDAGRPLPGARAWIGDREYAADERGAFVVPFSTSPGPAAMLLAAGDVASVAQLELVAETAELVLVLALDRQGLTAGRTAQAIARLALTIGGAPASLALIRQASWDVTLIDRQGVATTRSQPLALSDDAAAVLAWPLGDDTAEVAIAVRGKLEIASEQRERDVAVQRRWAIAAMHAGPATEALYLACTDAGWVVSALGKTGEPRAHRPVTIGVVHRWAWTQLNVELATDERGRVELGALPGARRITATLGGLTQTWELEEPAPGAGVLHTVAGRALIVHLPASRSADEVLRRASLVELRAGAPARHVAVAEACRPLAGAIAIHGLAPGDYQLCAPGIAATMITVAAASAEHAGWAIAPAEVVQVPRAPAAIAAIEIRDAGDAGDSAASNQASAAAGNQASAAAGEEARALIVRLAGGDVRTRVHVIATRFAPAPIELLRSPAAVPRRRADRAPGVDYVSARELGDEYRYILERRAAPRFPGMLIDRPSLLLNPWARRATATGVEQARPPGVARPSPVGGAAMQAWGGRTQDVAVTGADESFAAYDFLAEPPVVLANLAADARGELRVALAELGPAATVTVIVDDPAGMSTRRIALAEPALAPRDLRLRLALDPERHVRQHKAIDPLHAGGTLVIEDLATAALHLVDSVERAHAYLLALRDDPALREFAFVTRWHALPDAERRALYSKYACHELHLFLYARDRAFFDAVIRPYLAHKRAKAFVDRWLLGEDLAPYLEPARLVRLNAVERALLAQRLTAEAALPRLLADEVAVLPPDPAGDARRIDALLGAATRDADGDVARARDAATELAEAEATGSMAFAAEVAESAAIDVALEAPRSGPNPAKPGRYARKLARPAMLGAATSGDDAGGGDDDLALDAARRGEPAPWFRGVDQTQEWAETQWWRRTVEDSGPEMIPPSRLWRDLAHHPGGPFLSPWLGLATGSFAEAMCALAVTDLPFVAPAHAITSDGPRLTVVAAGHALAGSSQLVDGELVDVGPPLVVGMSYVRADDRHDWVGGEQIDKYVEGPLAAGVVYTCQVVLANPTSSPQRIAALIQIPRGSMPVAGARPTRTIDALLGPYGTHGHEVSFYFPAPGRWSHFPVHVSRAGQIVAAAPPRTLEVQDGGAAPDPRSWPHVSQRAPLDEVIAYLATANLAATDLADVAWRLREPRAYAAIVGALEARRAFDDTLWSYALVHRDAPRLRAWLRTRARDLLEAGPALDMIGVDAEDAGAYEHLELAPLIHARAHRLGAKLRILNDGLAAQYDRFLRLVAHRPAPTSEDLLAAAHYLFAQDRVPAALAVLTRVDPARLVDERMQHDYLAGYAACLTGDLGRARALAARWRDHPVDRWRHRFGALAALLDEATGALAGAAAAETDPRSREHQHAALAARQPAFELAVDRDGVVLRSQHVARLELRFFEMDVELLFSRQPFVQSDLSRFSFIEPGHRELVLEPPPELRVAWPLALHGKNVVVEAVGAGVRRARVHHANDLATTLAHGYGRIRVQRASDGAALAATYVKVYARAHGGAVAFYKDGYTDLRGWFDYASLSTGDLGAVERFALLVCSDHAGAAILEASPPAR